MPKHRVTKLDIVRNDSLRRHRKLSGKIQPPRFTTAFVARPRLLDLLLGTKGVVWLVRAPAGYGKTVLLTQFYQHLADAGCQVAWLNLSAEDNDPPTLLCNLTKAYGSHLPVPTDMTTGLTALRDSLEQQSEAGYLFLDGLEAISDPSGGKLLDTLLLGLPDNITCVVAGRTASALRLYEGRLRGLLKDLSLPELCFDETEAEQLFGNDWSRSDVEILNNLLQGWPAGLRFMALDRGTARQILDGNAEDFPLPAGLGEYYEKEICARLDADTLADVMDASVVSFLSPEVINRIPGRPCSWQRLLPILQDDIFIRAATPDQPWTRFHPAFGQFLRDRLYCRDPARFDELECFAADWFQTHGHPIEAMRHARKSRDGVYAATVMQRVGALQLELRDDTAFRSPWHVSRGFATEFPLVCLNQIYFLIRKGKHHEARTAFDRMSKQTGAFQDFPEGVDLAAVEGYSRMILTILDVSDDLPVTQSHVEYLEQEFRRLRETDTFFAASIASLLSLCYISHGRYDEAAVVNEIALSDLNDLQVVHVSFFLRLHNAVASLARGRLREAGLYNEQALRLAQSRMISDKYEMLAVRAFRAELHYENNEIDRVEEWMTSVLDKMPAVNGWFELYAAAYGTASAVAGLRGGLEATEPYILAAEKLAKQRNIPRLLQFSLILRLRETTRAWQLRSAADLFEQPDFQNLLEPGLETQSFWYERIRVAALLEASRLMIALGHFRASVSYLERVNKAYLEDADIRIRFTFRMLAMQTAFHLRRYNSAYDHLLAGLELGIGGGLIRRTLDHRTDILTVFDWCVHNGRNFPRRIRTFVDTALRDADETETALALRYRSAGTRPATSNTTFVLSPRETEIIALIAEGYASKEIAYRLGISEGTVKTHRKKIHKKLGVTSRAQAIAKARSLLMI